MPEQVKQDWLVTDDGFVLETPDYPGLPEMTKPEKIQQQRAVA